MAILAISHVMKSTGYEHQNYKFRVFRQSLPWAHKLLNLRYLGVIKRIETGPIRVISITYHRQLFFRFLTISQIRKFKYM